MESKDKIELLKNRLQASVDYSEKMNEDLDAVSWNYQEGILMSCNDAKLIVELLDRYNEAIEALKLSNELLKKFKEIVNKDFKETIQFGIDKNNEALTKALKQPNIK